MKNLDEMILGTSSLVWSFVYSFSHLAQVGTPFPIPESIQGGLVDLLSQFGGLGLAVWLVYRHTTVTIPNMQIEHRKEREAAEEKHSKTLEKLTASHIEALDRKRQEYLAALPKVVCRFTEKE